MYSDAVNASVSAAPVRVEAKMHQAGWKMHFAFDFEHLDRVARDVEFETAQLVADDIVRRRKGRDHKLPGRRLDTAGRRQVLRDVLHLIIIDKIYRNLSKMLPVISVGMINRESLTTKCPRAPENAQQFPG